MKEDEPIIRRLYRKYVDIESSDPLLDIDKLEDLDITIVKKFKKRLKLKAFKEMVRGEEAYVNRIIELNDKIDASILKNDDKLKRLHEAKYNQSVSYLCEYILYGFSVDEEKPFNHFSPEKYELIYQHIRSLKSLCKKERYIEKKVFASRLEEISEGMEYTIDGIYDGSVEGTDDISTVFHIKYAGEKFSEYHNISKIVNPRIDYTKNLGYIAMKTEIDDAFSYIRHQKPKSETLHTAMIKVQARWEWNTLEYLN